MAQRVNLPKTSIAPGTVAAVLLLVLAVAGACWFWFGWRIEPPNCSFAVLMRKTGEPLPPDQILADHPGQKGIQLEVVPEGRIFRNPLVWSHEICQMTSIAAGRFGVLVRKYGKDLPEGEIIAPSPEYKGIVPEVLGTGRHRINPYAYDIQLFNDIRIAPGYVGVVTKLTGEDLFSAPGKVAGGVGSRGFLSAPGCKGVQAQVLREGTHRLNPYIYSVSLVNIQSQRIELTGNDAIMFLTLDGFPITVEGTLEFNIDPEKAALLTHEIGDMDDIRRKIILPYARGFSRLEGSKQKATAFIVGESRQAFQDSLEKFLKSVCAPWGISLNSVLIRDIIPPQDIAAIIRDRELAAQECRKIEQQIVQAKSLADLERQKALADQSRQKVLAETEQIRSRIAAEQAQVEKLTQAKAQLEVARIGLETAKTEAQAKLTIAEATRKVVEHQNRAEADVLRQQVQAYGSEGDYVEAALLEKLAPQIKSITVPDVPDGILGLPVREGKKGGAQ
ncbi:MAG: SPFH domain-containing protein [Kiritimatiellia bacterium]|nr:SPFH domain-containing protein [Kiritimatiellia bacterium]